MKTPISQVKRSQIVALVARGDTTKSIADSVGVSQGMVSKLKKDEAESIKAIQQQIQESKVQAANRILDKTNALLEDRVDKAGANDAKRSEYAEQLDNNEIDSKKYNALLRALPTISTTDLISMSREMFNQSVKGDETPPGSPESQKEALYKLLEELKDGNEVHLERIIFNPQ